MKFNVSASDKVLEVGSGDSPRNESAVILDRYITTNHQRAGKFKMRIDRPLVVGNGYSLPFKDNAFDYVICSHVLEHVTNPIAFAKELMRVGKRGYVEVPSIYGERLFGWTFHLWHNEFKNNQLIMTPKKDGERFGEFFHTLIARQIWFRRFIEENEKKFYIQFEWNKKFIIKVNKEKLSEKYVEKIDNEIWQLLRKIDWDIQKDILFYVFWMKRRIVLKCKKIIKKVLWNIRLFISPQSVVENLLPYLQCIKCENSLIQKNKKMLCIGCKATYVLQGVIPVLLSPEEVREGY